MDFQYVLIKRVFTTSCNIKKRMVTRLRQTSYVTRIEQGF